MLPCPNCGRTLLDSGGSDGVKRLRTRIVLFEENATYAVCPECKEQVEVPIVLLSSPKQTRTNLKHIVIS